MVTTIHERGATIVATLVPHPHHRNIPLLRRHLPLPPLHPHSIAIRLSGATIPSPIDAGLIIRAEMAEEPELAALPAPLIGTNCHRRLTDAMPPTTDGRTDAIEERQKMREDITQDRRGKNRVTDRKPVGEEEEVRGR